MVPLWKIVLQCPTDPSITGDKIHFYVMEPLNDFLFTSINILSKFYQAWQKFKAI